jgi:hypothetical protein
MLAPIITFYLLTVTTDIFSFWVEKGMDFDRTQGNILSGIIGNIIFSYTLYCLIKNKSQLKGWLIKHWAVFVVFILFFFSCFWSDFPDIAVRRFFKVFIIYILLLLASVKSNWNYTIEKSIKYYSICVVGISFILIYLFPTYGLMVYDDGSLLPKGVFGHKNSLGIFGAISSLWFITQLPRKSKIDWILFISSLFLLFVSKSSYYFKIFI